MSGCAVAPAYSASRQRRLSDELIGARGVNGLGIFSASQSACAVAHAPAGRGGGSLFGHTLGAAPRRFPFDAAGAGPLAAPIGYIYVCEAPASGPGAGTRGFAL